MYLEAQAPCSGQASGTPNWLKGFHLHTHYGMSLFKAEMPAKPQVRTSHNEDKCPLEVSSNCGMHFAMELYCLLIRVTFGQSHYIWNQTRDLKVKACLCTTPLPDLVSRGG